MPEETIPLRFAVDALISNAREWVYNGKRILSVTLRDEDEMRAFVCEVGESTMEKIVLDERHQLQGSSRVYTASKHA